MSRFVLNLLLFVVVLLVGLELVFRTLIPASNIAYKTLDKKYGILLHDTTGGSQGESTTGRLVMRRAPWRINNFGWRSDKDYLPPSPARKPVIALIGDSFIAGFQVSYADHFASLLERLLSRRYDVYNLGSGGVPASQDLYVAEYARDLFDPDVYIILVNDKTWRDSIVNYQRDPKVRQIRWKQDHFEDVLPVFTSSRLSRLRKRSALIRYLVYNANIDLFGGIMGASHHAAPPDPAVADTTGGFVEAYPLVENAMRYIVGRLREELPDKKIVFMTNVMIENVYAGRPRQSIETVGLLKSICAEKGIPVLDLAPVFAAEWKAHHKPLTFEIDYHWNEYGHQLVAKTLYDFLMKEHMLDSSRTDSLPSPALASGAARQ